MGLGPVLFLADNKNQAIMGERLREIYKGERISFLNVIFMAENITVLLDKIYYQQLLAKKDADQLAELKKQVDETYITPIDEKIKLIESFDVDYLIIINFTKDVAGTDPVDFVDNYLVNIGVKAVEIGKGMADLFDIDRLQ